MIKIAVVIEEMLDEHILFGGEFVHALASFVMGPLNVLEDERQLGTNVIDHFLFHEGILFVFGIQSLYCLYYLGLIRHYLNNIKMCLYCLWIV
jgi:hypothetical protein